MKHSLYTHPRSPEDRSGQPAYVGVQPENNTDTSSINSDSLCNDLMMMNIDSDESVTGNAVRTMTYVLRGGDAQ